MYSCEDVLQRDSYDTRSAEKWRILVAAACFLVGGTAWHLARDSLLRNLARTSVGCPWREELIAWAVFGREPSAFENELELEYDLRRPAWIALSSPREHESSLHRLNPRDRPIVIVDDELRIRGRIVGPDLALPPVDADGDDKCEVVIKFDLRDTEERVNAYRWGVIRLGSEFNEVLWVGLVSRVWHGRPRTVDAAWRDDHGSNTSELVFLTIEIFRTSVGKPAFKPPKTVAVFRWDRLSGMLHPQSLPDDGSVLSWTPGKAVQVGQDDDIYAVLRDLLPVPEGFGQ